MRDDPRWQIDRLVLAMHEQRLQEAQRERLLDLARSSGSRRVPKWHNWLLALLAQVFRTSQHAEALAGSVRSNENGRTYDGP